MKPKKKDLVIGDSCFLEARDSFGNVPVYIHAEFEGYIGDHNVVGSFRLSPGKTTLWPVCQVTHQAPLVQK